MHDRGTIVFGGFGHHSRNLALGDPSKEIRQCFAEMQSHLGLAPTAFAYPHGQYREHTITAVRRAGFTSAMATVDEVERTGRAMKIYSLRRVSMNGGLHRFDSERVDAESQNAVTFQVTHEGIPLKVTPRLVVDSSWEGDAWLEPSKLRESATLHWEVSSQVATNSTVRLELWDHKRVIRFYPPAS